MAAESSRTGRPNTPALVGLRRLLGLPHHDPADHDSGLLRQLVDERMDRVVAGLVAEAASSDDVIDRQTGIAYLDARLRDLAPFLTPGQVDRLRAAALELIHRW